MRFLWWEIRTVKKELQKEVEDLRLKCFELEELVRMWQGAYDRRNMEVKEFTELNNMMGQSLEERDRELKKIQEYYHALSQVKNALKAELDRLRMDLAIARLPGGKPDGGQGVSVSPGKGGVSGGTT
jgi:septal ring factor EnvC (AmiA/AmiB activator)